MRKKIERSLLVVALLVFICIGIYAVVEKIVNYTNFPLQATSAGKKTITYSSSRDVTFILIIEATDDTSTTTSWISEEFTVNAGETITCNLDDIVPGYSSYLKYTFFSIKPVIVSYTK